jgi:hypothetical protein
MFEVSSRPAGSTRPRPVVRGGTSECFPDGSETLDLAAAFERSTQRQLVGVFEVTTDG